MKLSDKIKTIKKEILEEVKGKVYKFSKNVKDDLKKQHGKYECDCSFTVEEVDDGSKVEITELQVKLRPYKVCEWCKDQMMRPIGELKGVIAGIENGNLEVEPMDTVKKVGK